MFALDNSSLQDIDIVGIISRIIMEMMQSSQGLLKAMSFQWSVFTMSSPTARLLHSSRSALRRSSHAKSKKRNRSKQSGSKISFHQSMNHQRLKRSERWSSSSLWKNTKRPMARLAFKLAASISSETGKGLDRDLQRPLCTGTTVVLKHHVITIQHL